MTTISPFKPVRQPDDVHALDRLTAAYARVHADHESPLVGCYLCLHNEPRRREVLAAAA